MRRRSNILANPALKTHKEVELNEEWNNFMQRIGEVSGLVKDLASGDKDKSEAAKLLADQYLEGKVINEDNVEMKIKHDRTLINHNAFRSLQAKDTGEMDKDAWMAEVSRDADMRHKDRMIRKEKADTLKTLAMKAFRREEYDKAVTYYTKAIDQIKDNPMFYCDRALTYIKLMKYDKVEKDCDTALRLNEKSYKARLYRAKAYKELEDAKFAECHKELQEMFPQHNELTKYFLEKKNQYGEAEEGDGEADGEEEKN